MHRLVASAGRRAGVAVCLAAAGATGVVTEKMPATHPAISSRLALLVGPMHVCAEVAPDSDTAQRLSDYQVRAAAAGRRVFTAHDSPHTHAPVNRPAERPVSASRVEMIQMIQPSDANSHGNVHGGAILRLIDEAGGIAAYRHSRGNVVTARMESMDFHQPMYMGEIAIVRARLTFVSAKSMEVRVEVSAENLRSGVVRHTNSAILTFVALDDTGATMRVPRLVLETDEDRELWHQGQRRYEARKRERAAAAGAS